MITSWLSDHAPSPKSRVQFPYYFPKKKLKINLSFDNP